MDYKIESETTAEISTALSIAQGQFRPAVKNKKNPFYKSEYADLESVDEATQPALRDNGLSFTSSVVPVEGKNILIGTLRHKSGEFFRTYVSLYCKEDMHSYGAAMTYARRYALVQLCNIVTEDDDGEGCMEREFISAEQANKIADMIKEINEPGLLEKILSWLGVDSFSKVPKSKFKTIESKLKEKLGKINADKVS